jgi:hypothetical protein
MLNGEMKKIKKIEKKLKSTTLIRKTCDMHHET